MTNDEWTRHCSAQDKELDASRGRRPPRATTGFDISQLLKETGHVTLDVGFVNTASCTSADHLHRRRRRDPALPRLPDRAAGREVHASSRSPTCSSTASCRRQAELDGLRRADPPAHAAARGPQARSSTASRATRTRCRCCPRRSRRCRPSTRTASTPSTRSRSRSRPSACSPSCRRSRPTRYKKCVGQPFLYPDNSLSLVENFLRMTFGFPAEPYEVDPTMVKAARPAAHPARRPRAELLDLDGAPRRLGAGQPVRLGLRRHQRPVRPAARRRQPGRPRDAASRSRTTATTSTTFVTKVKNKEDGVRLMGFGHRVYKNYDPRAAIIKKTADDDPRASSACSDPLLDIAMRLEEIALADDYFVERKLYPNVDFYTGLIYKAMGFPTRDVHRAVRPRPAARLDRPVARDDRGPGDQDRPPAPGLHRRHRARLRRRSTPR